MNILVKWLYKTQPISACSLAGTCKTLNDCREPIQKKYICMYASIPQLTYWASHVSRSIVIYKIWSCAICKFGNIGIYYDYKKLVKTTYTVESWKYIKSSFLGKITVSDRSNPLHNYLRNGHKPALIFWISKFGPKYKHYVPLLYVNKTHYPVMVMKWFKRHVRNYYVPPTDIMLDNENIDNLTMVRYSMFKYIWYTSDNVLTWLNAFDEHDTTRLLFLFGVTFDSFGKYIVDFMVNGTEKVKLENNDDMIAIDYTRMMATLAVANIWALTNGYAAHEVPMTMTDNMFSVIFVEWGLPLSSDMLYIICRYGYVFEMDHINVFAKLPEYELQSGLQILCNNEQYLTLEQICKLYIAGKYSKEIYEDWEIHNKCYARLQHNIDL